MFSLLLSLSVVLPGADPTDTLVVCPASFQPALAPWIAHRSSQGHVLHVVDAGRSREQLRAEIRKLAAGGSLRYVVLVGDAPPIRDTTGAA